MTFQYRKRYEVTCDEMKRIVQDYFKWCFNTASGMRSHATINAAAAALLERKFQYRKRYEVTCDLLKGY